MKVTENKSLQAQPDTKALPVLPWMRVPVSIEGSTGVPLVQVAGLHPLALAALQTGAQQTVRVSCMHAMLQQLFIMMRSSCSTSSW